MDPIQKFQTMLVVMQIIAFLLGMLFERRLESLRKEYETKD